MKKLSVVLISLSIFFVVGAVLVSAQTGGGGSGGGTGGGGSGGPSVNVNVKLDNPFNCGGVSPCNLFVFLKTIINKILMPIGGVLAVLAFIYVGFLYVTAQGNPTKITYAHKALLAVSIGTAILLGAWVLANVICTTIGQLGGPGCPAGASL